MAEINKSSMEKGQVVSGSDKGHQVTGKVAILYGTVKAISPDGTVRVLKLNSPVYADDRIITGDDGSVSIIFDTIPATQLDLGRVSDVVIDEDVYGIVSPEVTAEASAEQKAIQAALLAGDQPIDVEATAAGTESSSGGGHPVYVVNPDWVHVTPESGAETTGIKWSFAAAQEYPNVEQPENSIPTITVDPGNGTAGDGITPVPYDGGTGGSGVIGGATYINDVVYEAGLTNGSDAAKTTTAAGTFTISDTDGLGDIASVTINGTTIAITDLVGTHVDGLYGTLTITGYDPSTGVGTYSYELTKPATDGPGTETDIFHISTTDQGGATSTPATINVEIVDDLPNAVDDFDSIAKDDGSAHTGNVFTNDLHPNGQPGADIPVVFDTWTGSTTALYGTFVPNADGTYSYTLDTTNPVVQGLQGGETLTETFTYQIHDADGDIDTATLTITIVGENDIPPVVSISTGLEGGSAVEGNPVTFTVTQNVVSDHDTIVKVQVIGVPGDTATADLDYTKITTLDVKIAAGSTSATFDVQTLVDQLQEGSETFTAHIVSATNPNGAVTVGTADAIGTILDNYDNITPTAGASYAYVDDDGLPGGNPASTLGDYAVPDTDGDNNEATFSGKLNFTTGNIPATINAFAEMDGKTGTVGQKTVTYSWNNTTDTLTATGPRGVLFTVQMTDTTTGEYKVTLLDNVLHETLNGLPGDDTENDATVALTYTVTDNDGETATGTLNITFNDDMPTAYAKEHVVTIQAPESEGVISSLASGWYGDAAHPWDANVDNKYNSDSDPYYETIDWGDSKGRSSYVFNDANVSNVHIDESFSLGTFTHNNFPITSGSAIKTAYLKVTFDLTVGGETVHVDHVVQFNHNETPNTGDGNNEASRDIVTIVNGTNQVDVTVGDYTYTLNIGFQDASNNPITEVFTWENKATTFNLIGKLTASLDNAPTVSGVIDEGTDVNFGADGSGSSKIVAITHNGITYDSDDLVGTKLTIASTHEGGQFVIDFSTGEYKYTAPSGESYVDRSEVFTYTVEDADGDRASSTITMNIPGESVPTVGPNAMLQLDDDALTGGNPGGIGDDVQSVVMTGTLSHDYGDDGAGTTLLTGATVPAGFTVSVNPAGTVLTISQGGTAVLSVTLADTVSGNYTVSQLASVHHPAGLNENNVQFTLNYTTTDSNGDSAHGTFMIDVDDDTPIAGAQRTVVEANTSTAGTNLLIILDVSGSMADPSGVSGYTRLALAKKALGELIDEYDSHGDVKVRLVTFSDNAAKVGSVWMDAAAAKAAINGYTAKGSTNYDAALITAQDAFDDSGALTGAQNISYFLSDGEPNRPSGSVGINASEETNWENFLKANDITSFALGMGTGVTQSALNPVAYDGVKETEMDAVVVTNLSQLSAVLLGTVVIPTSVEGELITGADGVSFGADGPGTYKIVSVEYNGTTHGTGELTGNELTINTTIGGKLIVDFTTGHYSYTAPTDLTTTSKETFTYTIMDSDGDTASNTLKIHVLPEDSTQDYSASTTGITASATTAEPNIIGSAHDDHLTGDDHANFLVGGEGNDVLVGGAGNDNLVGGAGNNTLTGGTGADTFMLSNGGHDTITDYDKSQGDKVDISNVLNEDAGDYLNVVDDGSGHAKLEILNSSGVEKASVTFTHIDFDTLDSAHLLDSLLNQVDVDHNG